MFVVWLVALFWCSVAAQQNRVIIPPDRNCVLDADGGLECFDKDMHCPRLLKHFDLRDDENSNLLDELVYGHNGLRNRLAMKLDTCDMLEMSWDDYLAELANRDHLNCFRSVADFKKIELNLGLAFDKVVRGNSSDLARSSFFLKNIYFRHFLEFAVASWYDMHVLLNSPERIIYKNINYFKVLGDNCFTRIINPHTHRFGCSYAMFYDGLSLICYYFPYMPTNNSVFLRKKPEEYQCPYSFPILNPIFKRLCRYAEYKQSTERTFH